MKLCSIFLCLFCTQIGASQILIDPTLPEKYTAAIQNFPKNGKAAIEKWDKTLGDSISGFHGLVVCSLSKIDTLNKKELKKLGFELEKNPEMFGDGGVLLATAQFQNGVLKVGIGQIFEPEFITHEIKNDSMQTTFRKSYKQDFILKLEKSDKLTNELQLPVVVQNFSLSTTSFEVGTVLYGSCEFETQPYFIQDFWEDDQFLQLKNKYKYVFKVKIQ